MSANSSIRTTSGRGRLFDSVLDTIGDTNLAHFVADWADSLGLQNRDLEPNPDANG